MLQENEKWIEGSEGRYSVNADGQVFSFVSGERKELVGSIGYRHHTKEPSYRSVLLVIDGVPKQEYVHRLVAKAFIPNPENKRTVNHKDCNKLNNNVENLEWATFSENTKHAYENNLIRKIDKEEIYKRTLEYVDGNLDSETLRYYKKWVDREQVQAMGIPADLLKSCLPSSHRNLRQYWAFLLDLFACCNSNMKLQKMADRFDMNIGQLCKIRSKENYKSQWKAYEKYLQENAENVIVSPEPIIEDGAMKVFVVKVTYKEAKSTNNSVVTKEGVDVWICNDEGYAVGCTTTMFPTPPADVIKFQTAAEAERFAKSWKGAPRYFTPSGKYEIIEMKPKYKQVFDGWEAV